MKRIVSVFVMYVLIHSFVYSQNVVDAYGQLSVQGTHVVSSQGVPVQLRGMSFFWSQWLGKYYTYNTVEWLRDDWKCTVVRAAMGVNKTADGYLVSPDAEKAKIYAVVDAAIDLGIYVIVDWHSHNALDADETTAAVAFFGELAQKYGQYPNIIYETFNEPLNVSWSTALKPYHLKVIEQIRKYDSDNIIICGTSTWSQDVDDAANNPITEYSNIAYTLHYYAATHKASLRTKATNAMNAGACLFVTEFGTCASDGGDPIDSVESKVWWDFLDNNKISWCNWSVADKVEAASSLPPNASPNGGWDSSTLTISGTLVRNEMRSKWEEPVIELGAPVISSNPQNKDVSVGDSVFFKVSAYGVAPMSIQWYKDGKLITGATNDTLILRNITQLDMGNYYAIIENELGTDTSNSATLKIVFQRPYNGITRFFPGIIQAEDYDEGGEGIAYHDETTGNAGGKYRSEDVDIENCTDTDGGFNVGWCDGGDWINYTATFIGTGIYTLEMRVASNQATGSFSMDIDGVEIVPTTFVANTSGWQKWITKQIDNISVEAGVHVITVRIKSGSFNINYLKFTSVSYVDCNQTQNGSAYFDDCGTCVSGTTGLEPCYVQYIQVNKGWNLLPILVEASDLEINSVFPNASIIKDELSYYDASGETINSTFSTLIAGNGYKVYSDIDHQIVIKGNLIDAETTQLEEGWNLVVVPLSSQIDITELPASVSIVKDFTGFYDSNDFMSTLVEIKSGNVYFFYSTKVETINW